MRVLVTGGCGFIGSILLLVLRRRGTLRGQRISGIVAVEPGGAPDPARSDLSRVKGLPNLFIWGDNLAQNEGRSQLRAVPDRYHAALLAGGATSDLLDLPAQGIRGNSHMVMMDRNSDQIAARIQAWMMTKGLMK